MTAVGLAKSMLGVPATVVFRAARCVGDALSAERFDRKRCYAVCLHNEERHRELGKADVCGKCLAGVPCSFVDPVRAASRET